MSVGIVHPGAMGASLAGAAVVPVCWASDGRSEASRVRAERYGLEDVGSLDALVSSAEIVISVCPPHAAMEVARDISDRSFDGIYVDANAVSPAVSREIGRLFDRFVDGGIVGPPPDTPDTTRLYLAGTEAETVISLWRDGRPDVRVVGEDIGAASALKMAYAGWTKGSAALLVAVRAYAETLGVADALIAEWELSQPGLNDRVERIAAGVGPKAWRFSGEMDQIAASLADAGLPPGFHDAAEFIYSRLGGLQDVADVSLEDLLDQLQTSPDERNPHA